MQWPGHANGHGRLLWQLATLLHCHVGAFLTLSLREKTEFGAPLLVLFGPAADQKFFRMPITLATSMKGMCTEYSQWNSVQRLADR